jgi:ABC-type cobalamin/Fe3+-siderophores transport system ATPase subunit
MLKLEIDDKDLANKKILFNLHSIENDIDYTDKIIFHKKEVFNSNDKMNQGFIDLISAYFYVENKVLNKNK